MYFLIEDDKLLEKYNAIWNKVSADIKEEFDNEPVYNKGFLKTKIKSYGDEVTAFYEIFLLSSNELGFCSQKRRKLLSVSVFKRG